MVFHERLGTVADKVERVAKLAGWHVSSKRGSRSAIRKRPSAPALLAKADLVTGMVGEFPELQGIIGGYYAERAGEKPGAVSALKQQYMPVRRGLHPGRAVALADRIDTLASFFASGIKPTGSKDPFALRRAALRIIQTILTNGPSLG